MSTTLHEGDRHSNLAVFSIGSRGVGYQFGDTAQVHEDVGARIAFALLVDYFARHKAPKVVDVLGERALEDFHITIGIELARWACLPGGGT